MSSEIDISDWDYDNHIINKYFKPHMLDWDPGDNYTDYITISNEVLDKITIDELRHPILQKNEYIY